jgi:hypothetical protein
VVEVAPPVTKMSRDAALHERTVQKVAADAINLPKRTRAKATRRAITTRTVRVDQRVMAVARELAGGDMSRIRIVHELEVIVR